MSVEKQDSIESTSILDKVQKASDEINALLPAAFRAPSKAVICGSGLAGLARLVQSRPHFSIDFREVTCLPETTGIAISSQMLSRLTKLVQGHQGRMIFGTMHQSSNSVVVVIGRHQYVLHAETFTSVANETIKFL